MNEIETKNNHQLAERIAAVLRSEELVGLRGELQDLCANLGYDPLDCAAALYFLLTNAMPPGEPSLAGQLPARPRTVRPSAPSNVKMVRYRLDVGRQHQISVELLKKVLVEESGVDINNISLIEMQDVFTLIELPDEMPPDIFQHLKSVEVNDHKLSIRRVKNRRSKKYGKSRFGRHRQPFVRNAHEPAEFGGGES